MRLRNNPNAEKILSSSEYVIMDAKDKYFNNDKPVHIEIGMGKGDFIIGMARQNPDINFIGVEKFATVMIKGLEKLEEAKLDNVLFLEEDATNLLDYFKPHTIGCIYVNFSDPWPKKRHYKRRLTYKTFLSLYEQLLVSDGVLKQKTDNVSLFESSLMSYNEYGMKFEKLSVDLHKSEYADNNVMSEYEKKFSGLGQPIFMAELSFNKGEK